MVKAWWFIPILILSGVCCWGRFESFRVVTLWDPSCLTLYCTEGAVFSVETLIVCLLSAPVQCEFVSEQSVASTEYPPVCLIGTAHSSVRVGFEVEELFPAHGRAVRSPSPSGELWLKLRRRVGVEGCEYHVLYGEREGEVKIGLGRLGEEDDYSAASVKRCAEFGISVGAFEYGEKVVIGKVGEEELRVSGDTLRDIISRGRSPFLYVEYPMGCAEISSVELREVQYQVLHMGANRTEAKTREAGRSRLSLSLSLSLGWTLMSLGS